MAIAGVASLGPRDVDVDAVAFGVFCDPAGILAAGFLLDTVLALVAGGTLGAVLTSLEAHVAV